MSEYRTSDINEEEKIDITGIFYDFLNSLKKTWWIIVLCTCLCAGGMFLKTKLTYTPMYTAEATVSVTTAGGNSGTDNASASSIGKAFPYILSSGMLNEKIEQAIGMDEVPGTISVSNISGTNLLTIKVTSDNALNAYSVLQAVIQNYDSVTKYVVGNTTMEIYSDNGVPTGTTGNAELKSSIKVGAAAGAVIGILLTVLYMLIYRTVSDSEDLSRLVNVRYLGTLPVYHKKKRSKGSGAINIMNKNVQQNYLESMRLIRTRIENRMHQKHARVLMVTSSIPGEGKTTVSCNLAASFAKEGKSVVLVDCDLRNPSVKETLGIKGEYPGIEALLKGETTYEEACCSYRKKGLELRVIPGSSTLSDNAEIFGTEAFARLLKMLKSKAEYIILDTPPAGLLVDSMYTIKQVDGVLYVVMCDFGRRHVIQRSVQELVDAGAEMIGIVLNGGKKSSNMHSYGYGYKGYSGYGNTSNYTNNKDAEDDDEEDIEETKVLNL